ncbi:MAG: bifunctional diaminohydroxyphosphoribosylaminopyrimidine deaminase/5-amino-6-(5-phosphoribosylamino)uracil reductase RibD [Phycisphaerae bacterium]|nr:bifunctional diaminohydroxyphosphoribosylaminopyrimidine deaminase/5-amino-6-(5-phosphoribosylamino)uracil reductase RibD [Phycisphaerae bacterium]
MMAKNDESFMRRALALARLGRGCVEPNPMVGAVLVRDGEIVAEGYHRRFGDAHAEVEALRAAQAAGADPAGATMYVTLEPCCHHGKTPPCTDALKQARVGRVVAAMEDPDENVAGQGLAILRDAGIEVTCGVCETEARDMLRSYIKLRTRHRPWCIAKWAQTKDGYLALPNGMGRWISGEESRRRVHELRSRCDGILVGIETVLADDPLLTNRSGEGNQPTRVVLDSRLRIRTDSQLVLTVRSAPLLIVTTRRAADEQPDMVHALQQRGAEVLTLPETNQQVSLSALLDELGRRNWMHLLVEGGEGVLRSFLAEGFPDELQVYVSPHTVGDANLPRLDVESVLADGAFRVTRQDRIGEDTFLRCLRVEK